jgi:hypothetical protein
MKIKITENQLKNLFLIKEQNGECYLNSDFLKGCKEIVEKDGYKYESSKINGGICYITFNKKIGDFNITIFLYDDNFMEIHVKTQNKFTKFTTTDVKLSGASIKISNFHEVKGEKSKLLSKVTSWDLFNKFITDVTNNSNRVNNILDFEGDIKKIEDLLSYNVDDEDFNEITTIVRKYMNNKEDFCKLRKEYELEYGDNLYVEIIDVSISTQSLVRRFHVELDKMGKCNN